MTIIEKEQIYGADSGIPSIYTKQSYRLAFQRFLRYLDKEGKQHDLLQQDPKLIQSQIIGYIHYLSETKKYGRDSLGTPLAAIFHFYEMNDVLVNKRKILRFMPSDDSESNLGQDRAYTHEEIYQMLQFCDEREKVIFLLMASTGMRIGAIEGLQIGHISKIPKYNLNKILVYALSKRARYYTFCSPECAAVLDSYLDFRKRFGDPLKPTSPLIREQFDIEDRFAAQFPKTLKYRSAQYVVDGVLKRSGLKTKQVARSHGFRKFAISQMIKAKVDYNTREYLVGHRQSRGLDFNYDRTSEEDRLEEYLKAVNLLTINPENRLKIKIYQLESEHSAEWTQLKTEMNELKRLLPMHDA